MNDYYDNKERHKEISREIWRQICATAPLAVLGSWGLHDIAHTEKDGRAALAFQVQGYLHTGLVTITYDEGHDLYDITLTDRAGRITANEYGVYCDQLTSWLDAHIERDPATSDEEYNNLVNQTYNLR